MFVLDTNVLIYYLRGDSVVAHVFEDWLKAGEILVVSTIVESELLSWPELTGEDVNVIEKALATLALVSVDSSVARVGATFRREYKVALLDALIAATAFLRNAPLVTRNWKDFKRIQEIELVKILVLSSKKYVAYPLFFGNISAGLVF